MSGAHAAPEAVPARLTWGERVDKYGKAIAALLFLVLSSALPLLDALGTAGINLPPAVLGPVTGFLVVAGTASVIFTRNIDAGKVVLDRAEVAADPAAPILARLRAGQDVTTALGDFTATVRAQLAALDAAAELDPLAPAREAVAVHTATHPDASRQTSVWA